MYADIKTIADKASVHEITVRRMMTREELVRGEHFASDHGVQTIFDQEKTLARMKELNVLHPAARLA